MTTTTTEYGTAVDTFKRWFSEIVVKAIGSQPPTTIAESNTGQVTPEQSNERVKATVYKANGKEPEREVFKVLKAPDGRYMFIATYSNNYRDDDWLPEIIALESHTRFVERVDSGEAPLPELWLFHQPEWKVGECFAVATDITENGGCWALAFGYFDRGQERIAEALMRAYEDGLPVAMSHGMPTDTIARLQREPSIIVQHETFEVSVLPRQYAANRITEFVTLDSNVKGKNNMPIDPAKRQILVDEMGIPEGALDALESLNSERSKAADLVFLEKKEKSTVKESEADVEAVDEAEDDTSIEATEADVEAVDEAEDDTSIEAGNEPVSRGEVAAALTAIVETLTSQINDRFNQIDQVLSAQQEQVVQLSRSKSVREIEEQAPATLEALIVQSMKSRSAVGDDRARVDGRSTLANQKPEEKSAESEAHLLAGLSQ